MINEFIENHLEFIDRPISRGQLQGFSLNNGFRILFTKCSTLTDNNRKKLIRFYNEKFSDN